MERAKADMNSNSKGALAEAKVLADLSEKGFRVAPVLGDMPFDIVVIDKKYNLYKVQVKHAKTRKGGGLRVKGSYRTSVNGKQLTRKYSLNEVDVIAVYNPDKDKCYYIPYNEAEKNYEGKLVLRVNTPKVLNSRMNLARDYRNFPTMDKVSVK